MLKISDNVVFCGLRTTECPYNIPNEYRIWLRSIGTRPRLDLLPVKDINGKLINKPFEMTTGIIEKTIPANEIWFNEETKQYVDELPDYDGFIWKSELNNKRYLIFRNEIKEDCTFKF